MLEVAQSMPLLNDRGEPFFEVPCDHPVAKNHVFYAVPELYAYHRTQGKSHEIDATYFIADVEKLLQKIQDTDPDMMKHSAHKYRGENAEGWLKYNSMGAPYKTGSFNYFKQPEKPFSIGGIIKDLFRSKADQPTEQLKLSTGNAGMLMLIQELGIKQLPIGVQADNREEALDLVSEISFGNTYDALVFEQSRYPNWQNDAWDFEL